MAKRTRIKKMPREQFQAVLNLNWAPVRLEGDAIPYWLRGIPGEALHSIYASGTPMPEIPYADPAIPSGLLIGGIDVYRHAPDDPVKLNKDWYGVITLAGSDSMLLVRGPLSDSEHWLDEIPERLDGAIVLAVPPKPSDEEEDA